MSVLRALAVAFAAIAVLCLLAAILGMVNGRMSPRTGTLLRAFALFCFVLTVVLNVASRS